MCLPLIAQVQSVDDSLAEVKLLEGQVVRVNATLQPEVKAGEYVLVDRGLILEVIAVAQVEEMLRFYTELSEMWAAEDAAHV
ncbi:MAG: HypC/HybG/HupF family hydrogenase formation chaperone [Thermomicrobiales bacterium]